MTTADPIEHIDPVDVFVKNMSAIRLRAAEYGSWNTFNFIGSEDATQVLPQDTFRLRAVLLVQASVLIPITAEADGTATNPGANGIITSVGAAAMDAIQAGGEWQYDWEVSLQGTIAAGDADNMQLTSPLNASLLKADMPGVVGDYPQKSIKVIRPAGQGVNVQAIGAASGASAVYGAQIVATPLGSPNAFLMVGSRAQVQNNQGGQIQANQGQIELRNQQALYVKPSGGSITVSVLAERFSPYELGDVETADDAAV